MAAKKLQDFVSSKINTPNVGAVHFNTNDVEDQPKININSYRKSSDISDKESSIEYDNIKEQNNGKKEDIVRQSSTKSSPGTKTKWESHITDVKKNINNAMEDAYTAINTLIKGDIKNEMDVDLTGTNNNQTSGYIERFGNIDSARDLNYEQTNSFDPSQNNGLTSEQKDLDFTDFDWLPTPKSYKNRKPRKVQPVKKTEIPRKVLHSLIQNYKFPLSRVSSEDKNVSPKGKIKLLLFSGVLVVLISVFALSLKILICFLMGVVTCYVVLSYCGLINISSDKNIISLPTLKELESPAIPVIEEINESDLDFHASKNSNYSCWVNMIGTYDVTSHNINKCYVVHLDIENKSLRIRRPNKKIPHRAMWNDRNYNDIIFISEVIIELCDIKLDLLPTGLVHKRLWSKKYPICITFPKSLGECVSELSFSDIFNFKTEKIYVFGRTCREKEELFRRLLNTLSTETLDYSIWNIVLKYLTKSSEGGDSLKSTPSNNKLFEGISRKLSPNGESEEDSKKVTYYNTNKEDEDDQEPLIEALRWKSENTIPQSAEYVKYMAKFMPSDMFLLASQVMHIDINYVTCNPELLCINALLGRVFWDFLRGSHWIEIVKNKIQSKLKKIHLPQIIDELTVVAIHFGKEIPLIRKFSRPYLDSRGLWFESEIAYTGGFSMILETKVNLFNLRNQMKKNQAGDENNDVLDENSELERNKKRSRSQSNVTVADKTAAFISSEEDSAESSSYSDDSGDERQNPSTSTTPMPSGGGSSKRIIRWVDKIARSPYFIKAADNKYIQRGMEMVSNTKLMLQVELHSISGTLAVNIPPPPSDRLWFGFRPSPVIKLSAKPKVGQKEISISKITDLIEKKLILEFQRVLVLPNMDDVPLPLLVNGSLDKYISNFQ